MTHQRQFPMNESRSLLWDYAKGLGIILVVYGHVIHGLWAAQLPMDKPFHEMVYTIIYSFHMPLFFFISGVFFLRTMEKHGFRGMLLNKYATVVYPYLVWSLLQGGIEVSLSEFTNVKTTISEVLALLWRPRAQFWFLYTLFFIFVISGLLYLRTDKIWTSGILILATLLFFVPIPTGDHFSINSFKRTFVYFALGISASGFLAYLGVVRWSFAAVAALAFVFFELVITGQSDWSFSIHEKLGELMAALAGISLVIGISAILPNQGLGCLAYLGRHSLEIYLMHVIAGSGARILLHQVLGIDNVTMHIVFGLTCGLLVPLAILQLAKGTRIAWLFSPPANLDPRHVKFFSKSG
jgi:fucose 4-O-acetylase-like acetyltransferase